MARDPDDVIDALARTAGAQLRRPAPAEGLARVERRSRVQRGTRACVLGGAVVTLAIAGFVLVANRHQPEPPADNPDPPGIASTTLPSVSSTVSTDLPVAPITAVPGFESAPPVYASIITDFMESQHVIDPSTGAEIGVVPIDGQANVSAIRSLQALLGRPESRFESPMTVYRLRTAAGFLEYPVKDFDESMLGADDPGLAQFDRCSQGELTVTGDLGAVLPSHVSAAVISSDGRWLVTVSGFCPVEGTLLDGASRHSVSSTLQVYDLSEPARPARALMVGMSPSNFPSYHLNVSPDGRYLAWYDSSQERYRVFELSTLREVPLEVNGCRQTPSEDNVDVGPWVGSSSLVLAESCEADSWQGIVIRDFGEGGTTLRVGFPAPPPNPSAASPVVRVDHTSFRSAADAWFILCHPAGPCWAGRGSSPLVALPDLTLGASFLPLPDLGNG